MSFKFSGSSHDRICGVFDRNCYLVVEKDFGVISNGRCLEECRKLYYVFRKVNYNSFPSRILFLALKQKRIRIHTKMLSFCLRLFEAFDKYAQKLFFNHNFKWNVVPLSYIVNLILNEDSYFNYANMKLTKKLSNFPVIESFSKSSCIHSWCLQREHWKEKFV